MTAVPIPEWRLKSIEAEMESLGLSEVYDYLLGIGNSPNMAAMLATQSPPGTWNTDTDFQRRERSRMLSMNDSERESIAKIARQAGINTTGKTYNGQLGKYTDPSAWVGDTNDIKHVAIQKGLEIDGMVKVNGYTGPRQKPKIAPDILDGLEKKARKKDPRLDAKCLRSENERIDLRSKLIAKHSSKR